MTFLVVFVLCVVVDWLYVLWTRASLQRSTALVAAGTSGLLALVGSVSTILYNMDHSMVVPVVAGHVIGSYTAVKYAHSEVQERD